MSTFVEQPLQVGAQYKRPRQASAGAHAPNLHASNDDILYMLEQINATLNAKHITRPEEILKKSDPGAAKLFKGLAKDITKWLGYVATQSSLHDKYTKLSAKGSFLKQFQVESEKHWQWLAPHKKAATPLHTQGDQDFQARASSQKTSPDYAVEKVWAQFCLKKR